MKVKQTAGKTNNRGKYETITDHTFSRCGHGFWLKNHQLIPWTAEELENWRKMRDPECMHIPSCH